MKNEQLLSLVEYLAYKAQCGYVSDLHRLDEIGKLRIYHALEKVSADVYSLAQWNDALAYLTGVGPQDSPELAREALLRALGG